MPWKNAKQQGFLIKLWTWQEFVKKLYQRRQARSRFITINDINEDRVKICKKCNSDAAKISRFSCTSKIENKSEIFCKEKI